MLAETVGFSGLAIVKRTRGKPPRTKYLTIAEHDKKLNEIYYNLATETLTLRMGVRWWGESGEQLAGVPLVPPEGREDDVYVLVGDAWHAESEVPTVTAQQIAQQFPLVMDPKYR